MDGLLLLLLMIIIGAVIGGVTNSLAIKMLFRPYRPVYLGKWRLPFTPGLIPKRRDEMAEQMGKMVVNHLLTPERIREKIGQSLFREKMIEWMSHETEKMLHSSSTISDWARTITKQDTNIDLFTEQFVEHKLNQFLKDNSNKPINAVLPENLIKKGDDLVPVLAHKVTEKGADYFRGEEGQRQLHLLLEKFLQGKGSMLNFLGTMFGSDKIIEKLQPEIVRFFEDPSSEAFIKDVIYQEWTNIQTKHLASFHAFIQTDKAASEIVKLLKKEIPLYQNLETPLIEWAPHYKEVIINKWIPGMMEVLQQFLIDRLPTLFDQLQLDEIVREQVDTFSVDRLEEMVLSISRREFKMITYLGAFLGGTVGFIQGIMVVFFTS
ncbi:uncharacterized membrane protein YheB (UPF0754 family) [Salibacterium salarium]|uniref:DUF445 domain-containing protein n=1 Tax=Salibacterium salarium TaxID=284579 RepID=UPI00278AE816|nr:DUF445 family protein [Salibacterium salarium]MDQ0299887.1 uncharacterized membrane protein YheB (UPF0754 family) [Salibacterium salarium]